MCRAAFRCGFCFVVQKPMRPGVGGSAGAAPARAGSDRGPRRLNRADITVLAGRRWARNFRLGPEEASRQTAGMGDVRFRDRVDAGRRLAGVLASYGGRDDVLVLGLPRGGVPVAAEVACALGAPLDVLLVRKLGVPGWEELAMGAIASGGVRVINDLVVRAEGIEGATIEAVAARELKELQRREIRYRGHAGAPDVRGRTVIVVDDGVATGSTIKAAVQAIRQQGPAAIVVAVPAASPEARAFLEPMVDEFVALVTPRDFRAVGQWYADFAATSDDEVTRLLRAAAGDGSEGPPGSLP